MKSHFSSQYLNMKAIYQKQLVLTNKHNVTLNKRRDLLKIKIFVCTDFMAQCLLLFFPSNLDIIWKIPRKQNPSTVIYFLHSLVKSLEARIDSVTCLPHPVTS